MSIVHVNQIRSYLEQNFSEEIDLTDLGNPPAEMAENFFLTRALTAFSLTIIGDAEKQHAAKALTDGSDDNGLDAIYYNSKNSTVYIVQSKWIHRGTGEPESGDIGKFVKGVKDLVNLKFDNFNDKIKGRSEELKKIMFDPATKFELILVHTGINFSEHSSRIIEEFLTEINDASEVCKFTLLNQIKLHEALLNHTRGEPITLNINIKEWGKVASPQEAFYGQVNGSEVATWWIDHNKKLFSKNIRVLLGKTDINDDIRNTIEIEPANFWYYNNGITIICDKITKSIAGGSDNTFGVFECENISIVNGAQTVGTIGKYAAEKGIESLNDVNVQLRIISLENSQEDFGNNITKNNNRQNKIENRDFVSMDPNQIRIKNELSIDGILYSILRSEDNISSETSFDLHESTTALACASGNNNIVVQLKREIGKLWESIDKTPYISLFNNGTTSKYLWNVVQLQRYFDSVILSYQLEKEGRDANILVHGNRLISLLIFDSLDKSEFRTNNLDVAHYVIDNAITTKIKMICDLLIEEINIRFESAVIPTLFKNLTKCNTIIDNLKTSIEAS